MLQEFDPNSVTIPCLRGILSEAGVCYNHVRLKAEFVVLLNSVVKPRAPKLLKTFLNVKPSDSGIMYIYTRGNSKDKPKHTRMGPNDPPDPNFKIEGKQKSELRTFLYQGELQTQKIPSKANLEEHQDLAEAKLAQLHAQWIPPVGKTEFQIRLKTATELTTHKTQLYKIKVSQSSQKTRGPSRMPHPAKRFTLIPMHLQPASQQDPADYQKEQSERFEKKDVEELDGSCDRSPIGSVVREQSRKQVDPNERRAQSVKVKKSVGMADERTNNIALLSPANSIHPTPEPSLFCPANLIYPPHKSTFFCPASVTNLHTNQEPSKAANLHTEQDSPKPAPKFNQVRSPSDSPPDYLAQMEEGLLYQMQDQLTYKEDKFSFDRVSWPPTNPPEGDLSQDLGPPPIPTNRPITLGQEIPPPIPPRPSKNVTSSARKYMFPQAEVIQFNCHSTHSSSPPRLQFGQRCFGYEVKSPTTLDSHWSHHQIPNQHTHNHRVPRPLRQSTVSSTSTADVSNCKRVSFSTNVQFAPGSIFFPQSESPFVFNSQLTSTEMSPMLAAQHLTAAWQEPAIAKVSASVPTTKPEPTTNQPSLQITLAGQHPTTVEQKKGVTETPEKFLSHDVTQPQLFPQPIVNAVFMKKPILAAVLAKDFIPPFNSISKNKSNHQPALAEVPRPNPTSPSLKLSNTVVPQPPASHQPTISEVSTDPMTKPESNNRPALAEVPHLNPTSPLTKSTFDSINPIKADNQSTVEDLSRMANNPKHSQSSSSTCSSHLLQTASLPESSLTEAPLTSVTLVTVTSTSNRMLFAAAPTSLPVPPMQKTKFTPDPQPSHLPTSFPSTQAHISFKPLPITKLMLPAPATQEPIIDNCQTSSNNI
ncbi:hypothetical protein MJO28_017145 [Puccinia striiformis f. sp. tritici]|nr:hypothetical protein MJO28_017145 [Puccinia striiformis f. sp. tritici]